MISIEYIILLCFILLAYLTPHIKIWTWSSIVLMLVLAVFREKTVGTDFLGYYEDFCLIQNLEHSPKIIFHKFEIGFLVLIYLYKQISNDYLLFGSLVFLPFFYGCIKFLNVSKVNIAYGLFVLYTFGFYFTCYNIMRQMMCIGFILMFIGRLYKSEYLKFSIIVVLFSILIHNSSIIMLLLIPIHYYVTKIENVNKKLLYISVIGSFALYYIGANFFINILTPIISALGLSRYGAAYLRTDYGEGGNMVSAMYTLFALIVIYCKNPDKSKFYIYAFIASIVLFNLANLIPTYASRIYWGLFVFSIPLISNMLEDKETKYRRLFKFVVIIFGLGYFFYAYYLSNFGEINPYIWRI